MKQILTSIIFKNINRKNNCLTFNKFKIFKTWQTCQIDLTCDVLNNLIIFSICNVFKKFTYIKLWKIS